MINKIKNKYNLFFGVIIAFILGQLVISEGYAILVSIQENNNNNNIMNTDFSNKFIYFTKIIALIIFVITIIIFNTKKFRKINLDKISVYIIVSLIISIFITMEIFIVLVTLIAPHIIHYMQSDYFISMNVALLTMGVCVLIFTFSFILLINKKVRYIVFLTKEVKNIKEQGFGKTIEVKGKDELADLCKSINNMSLELSEKIEHEKEIEKTKNELITNISHDLKTPLTSIIGYLELLNNENISEYHKKEYASIAYNKSLRLKTLVNELFEYTKLNSPDIKLMKVNFNIANLINQMVGESILGFSEKNINVILENPYKEIICNIDLKLFTRVLENLIKNAEKYSDLNSTFKVVVIMENEKIKIDFINKCEHLNEENLEQLFEKFYRIDKARSNDNEGSGLGLNIAKKIIELHNGTLKVKKHKDNIIFEISMDKV